MQNGSGHDTRHVTMSDSLYYPDVAPLSVERRLRPIGILDHRGRMICREPEPMGFVKFTRAEYVIDSDDEPKSPVDNSPTS